MFYFEPKNAFLALPGLVILVLALVGSVREGGALPAAGEGELLNAKTVVLDAGHGGADGGAVGRSGTLEKDVNLEIVLLAREFCDFLGVRTVLTRETDVSLGEGETLRSQKVRDLAARVELVSSLEDAVLISVHQNFYGDCLSRGAQVFYSGESSGGMALARRMQEKLSLMCPESGGREAMPIPRGNFMLENLECPAIIVECGFLSHPEEEMLLNSPEYRAKLAFAIAAQALECAVSDGGGGIS